MQVTWVLEVLWHNAANAEQHGIAAVLELNDPTVIERKSSYVRVFRLVEVQRNP